MYVQHIGTIEVYSSIELLIPLNIIQIMNVELLIPLNIIQIMNV